MANRKEYVRKHRDRLRAQGLVKREVWIPGAYTSVLKEFELSLRKGMVPNPVTHHKETGVVNTHTLYDQLQSYSLETGVLNAELVSISENATGDEVIHVQVADYEEFPIFVTVGQQQILAMMPLLDAVAISDSQRAELNQAMLEINTMVPLSDFAIVNGQYVLFGALSVNSNFSEVTEELLTLAGNVEGALELIDGVLA